MLHLFTVYLVSDAYPAQLLQCHWVFYSEIITEFVCIAELKTDSILTVAIS